MIVAAYLLNPLKNDYDYEDVAREHLGFLIDEKLDEEIGKMAQSYQMEADKLKSYMTEQDKDQMKEDLAVQEAVDLLVAEAKLV